MADFNPENAPTDKLFLFWLAYEKEAQLLEDWHLSTARIRRPIPNAPLRSTGNILYDAFLDTWGKDDFVNALPLDEKSYFSALGTVSSELRKGCFDVLNEILEVKPDGTFKVPLVLKIDEVAANKKAQDKIDQLLTAFREPEIPSLEEIDKVVKTISDRNPLDPYLKALLRMMVIETQCFTTQRDFLSSGRVS